MKSAAEFLTGEEKARIEAAVAAVEKQTSGEIVPMLVDASYEYHRAELIGGGSLALGLDYWSAGPSVVNRSGGSWRFFSRDFSCFSN